jgi:GGDEF domain-containing protein
MLSLISQPVKAQFSLSKMDLKVRVACSYKSLVDGSTTPLELCEQDAWFQRIIKAEADRCEKMVKSDYCQEVVKKDPILTGSIRSCDVNKQCADIEDLDPLIDGCINGWLIGSGEFFDSMIQGGASAWNSAFKHFRSWKKSAAIRLEDRAAFLKAADQDIAKKRELVSNLPKYSELSDEKLKKIPAAFLLVERDKQIQIIASQLRESLRMGSLWDRVQEGERETEERAIREKNGKSPIRNFEREMFKAVIQKLQERNARLECLDQRTRWEMICWGAAYIIDPVMVAKFAKGGAKLAKLVTRDLGEQVVKGAEENGFAKASVADRRGTTARLPLEHNEIFGKLTAANVFPGLPPSLDVSRYMNKAGEEILVFERMVVGKDGAFKRVARELPIDELTGAVDGNLPVGREFLEAVVKENRGAVTIAVVDVDNLGFVSKKFTGSLEQGTKQGVAAARASGDAYLKAVAKTIKEVTLGKGYLSRTGGDEFAIILNETDPKKVKQLLDQINKRVREDKDVRLAFTEESKARASAYRAETKATANAVDAVDPGKGKSIDGANGVSANGAQRAKEFRLGYAPYSQPNVSVGSVVVNAEELPFVFENAERQVAAQKIRTKSALGSDTTKYGGAKPTDNKVPKLTFIPEAEPPIVGQAFAEVPKVSPELAAKKDLGKMLPGEEKFRVGPLSVVEYHDELGRPVLVTERWVPGVPGGPRDLIPQEVFVNGRTGLIDARHSRGRAVAETFVSSDKTPNRGAVWVNVENLGQVNYFLRGSQSGDQILAATSAVLQREINKQSLPLKMVGSEFMVMTKDTSPAQVNHLVKTLEAALAKDPQVREVYAVQRNYISSELKKAKASGNKQAVKDLRNAMKKLITAQDRLFSVHGTAISSGDTLETVLERTRRLRYPND